MAFIRVPCPLCAWTRESSPFEERTESLIVIYGRLRTQLQEHMHDTHGIDDGADTAEASAWTPAARNDRPRR